MRFSGEMSGACCSANALLARKRSQDGAKRGWRLG